MQDHVDQDVLTNLKVIQLNSSALHLTWDSLPSYTFTDPNASVFIGPRINGYYLWMSTNSSSVNEWSQTELETNNYVYVKPQELDHCSVLKFQVGARLRFTEEVTRSAVIESCLVRGGLHVKCTLSITHFPVNKFSKKDVEAYIENGMLYFTIQVKHTGYITSHINSIYLPNIMQRH